MNNSAVETLKNAGISNPARLAELIRKTVDLLELDLTGLTVLTEAASGPFVVTPVIAARAGAKVLALTGDSRYATAAEVVSQTRAMEELCGVEAPAEIHATRTPELFAQADIVTNLGFVRPVDAEAIKAMKPSAVIPLMCEAWEFRPGDVDRQAARERGIVILGTDEDAPGLEVFSYSGWLGMKMLFDAQIEIHKSRLIVLSSDKFGAVISGRLEKAGAQVQLISSLKQCDFGQADAVIVADYTRTDQIIGPVGDMTAEELAEVLPGTTVIQFAGWVDLASLAQAGLVVFPGVEMRGHRMARTLADLGPRPVVELHAAGLKVGQALAEARLKMGMDTKQAVKYAMANSPAQDFTD